MKYAANVLSALRIVISLVLPAFSPLSVRFLVLYCICVLTDIADGYAARKTGSCTAAGAMFDSVADFVFVIAAAIAILPCVPEKYYIAAVIAAVLRLAVYAVGFARHGRFCARHTIANKCAGATLAVLPFLLGVPRLIPVPALACILSAAEELAIAALEPEYDANIKGLWHLRGQIFSE